MAKIECDVYYYVDEDSGEKVYDFESMADEITMQIKATTKVDVDVQITEEDND